MKPLVIFLFLLAASPVLSNFESNRKELNVKSLSFQDKISLFLAAKLNPKTFEQMPKDMQSSFLSQLFSFYYSPYIDAFFVDARQVFIQVKKLEENATQLPKIDWSEGYEFCFWVYCFWMELGVSTGDIKILGAEGTTTSTEVTPTSISNTFKVPFVNLTMPDFVFNITDFDFQEMYLYRNVYYSFENVTIGIDTDYHFVPEVGIQLANMSIYFYAGRVRGGLSEYSVWDFNGNMMDYGTLNPEESGISEEMMESWSYEKQDYTEGLQFSLNCLLSNGRSDPECLEEDDEGEIDYHRTLSLQLIQTLSLGALQNTQSKI